MTTTTTTDLGNVPHPVGATSVDGPPMTRRFLDSDGYEMWCRHGWPVDLDDDED